jgi:ribosomal protein L35
MNAITIHARHMSQTSKIKKWKTKKHGKSLKTRKAVAKVPRHHTTHHTTIHSLQHPLLGQPILTLASRHIHTYTHTQRFILTGKGKLKHGHSGKRHNTSFKSMVRLRRLNKMNILEGQMAKNMHKMIIR